MSRNKRNLFLVSGAIVALSAIGFAGSHLFSGVKQDSRERIQTSDEQRVIGDETLLTTSRQPLPAKLTLRVRGVNLTDVAPDADTITAYALMRELKASPLFDANATELGPKLNTEKDTFTFDVTLALKRPLELSDAGRVTSVEMPEPASRHPSRSTRHNF